MATWPRGMPPQVVGIVAAFLLSLSLRVLMVCYVGMPMIPVRVWMVKASVNVLTVVMVAIVGSSVGLPVGVGCVASAVGCYCWLLVDTLILLKLIMFRLELTMLIF